MPRGRPVLDALRHPLVQTALVLLLAGTLWAGNSARTREVSDDLAQVARITRVSADLAVVPAAGVPRDHRFGFALASVTAGQIRDTVARYGTELSRTPEHLDRRLIADGAVRHAWTRPHRGPCPPLRGELRPGGLGIVRVAAAERPVEVRARRFGRRPIPIATVRPGTVVEIDVYGDAAGRPWSLTAPGGCQVP